MEVQPVVAYIWCQELQDASNELPANPGRSSLIHGLIQALDLLEADTSRSKQCFSFGGRRAIVVPPEPDLATGASLRRYHEAAYVDFLLEPQGPGGDSNTEESDSSSSISSVSLLERKKPRHHGLEYDCPPFPSLAPYALLVSSATQTACRLITSSTAQIAINWEGGRHHALRNRASGFCYVADVVLGIMLLAKEGRPRDSTRSRRPRILYIDLDLHYGDGVAQAFLSPSHHPSVLSEGKRPPKPPQVLTLSIHHHSPGFFPPPSEYSGLPSPETPHPFTLSLPLAAYTSPSTYSRLWTSCVAPIKQAYDPDYVVIQVGADGLPGDPIGRYGAWSVEGKGGMAWCVEQAKRWNVPMCVLGGGGYDHASTARAWATVTGVLVGKELPPETHIPDYPGFPEFAPSYTLEVLQSNASDENSESSLVAIESVFSTLASRIRSIVSAH